MTKDPNQETGRFEELASHTLDEIISAAETLRTKRRAKKIDPKAGLRGELPGNLINDIYALKHEHYLAIIYHLDLLLPAVFYNRTVLRCVDAFLLQYDTRQDKWNVEAWNLDMAANRFTRLLQQFTPDWLKNAPALTPLMTLNRGFPPADVNKADHNVIPC